MASVHLGKGGRQVSGRRVDSEKLLDDVQRGAGLISKSPSKHPPSQRPLRKEAVNLSVQSRAQAWRALRGIAFGHSLLLVLSPWAFVVRAAIATGNRLFHWALLCARWLSMLSDRALCPVKWAHSRKRGSTM